MNPWRAIVLGLLWIPFVPIALAILRILLSWGDVIKADVKLREEELRGLKAHHRDRFNVAQTYKENE